MQDSMFNHPALIGIFSVAIIIMLVLDLGVLNRKNHAISSKEALIWSAVWISLAMGFSAIIYFTFKASDGATFALEKFSQFQSAYWIEKALSVDNLFVFILVFSYFKVPKEYQHNILFWGVLGALVFRAFFIFAGVELINRTYLPAFSIGDFNFSLDHATGSIDYINKNFFRPNIVLTLFGFFLIVAGVKSWFADDEDQSNKNLNNSFGAKVVRKFFRVSDEFDKGKFFTVQNGVKMATPLLIVLSIIEFTDLIFAVDSIPAIFAIAPDDPFILYTSNIFAILGLRSLYFLLANFMHMFSKLKYGLAIILSFIGVKMVLSPFLHISSSSSLLVVAGVLILSVIASFVFPDSKKTEAES